MRTSFKTVAKGLDFDSYPMRLWAKAKKYGVWDPAAIDFTQDKKDWAGLDHLHKLFIARIVTQFQAGEEAVTLDLLPLIMAVAKEGRIEEEMFLTSFLWEEAKHIEGFSRFINEVIGPDIFAEAKKDALVPAYQTIFYEVLPDCLNKLTTDASPENMARASVTYNMIIEGVLAETGYLAFHQTLEANKIMPGMTEFTAKLKQDESRHIAYGIFLLSRLISENGPSVWEAVEDQMQKMITLAIAQVQQGDDLYEGDTLPFGLPKGGLTAYAQDQFMKRFARIERARTQTLEEIHAEALV